MVARTVSAFAAALLTLAAAAAPVSATTFERDRYSFDYSFSFADCGFWIDVSGHTQGAFHTRVGKGELTSAFFAHDNFEYAETWTRRDTGDFFTVTGNGLFQETRALHIEGTIFQFSSVNAGQPFTVRDSEGMIILRDRGVVKETILFDTLGDGTPGGEFISQVSFSIAGPHPGFVEFDPCALLG
jgi:hypothetical protein